jgi:decaprenyl-phosphate phosphoribosyltransferase
MIRALLVEGRPKQWVKNVLVFAAPGAAGVLTEGDALVRVLVVFVAFCLCASGTYYWNDVLDVEADRSHPTKRFRPIASGAVPTARRAGRGDACSSVGGIALAFVPGWKSGVTVITYVLLTVSYSAIWKHIAVLDLIAIASGFVLRAVGGAVAAQVVMSTWFIICITFGALFIVTGKRYAEMLEMGDRAASTRAALAQYTTGYLRIVLAVSLGVTVVGYCTWAFETREVSGSSWPLYELSIVPMLAALLRYLLVLEHGDGGAPEEVFLADRTLQLLGLSWVVVFGLGVYVS